MDNRDLAILNLLIKNNDLETVNKVKGYLHGSEKDEKQDLLSLKEFLTKNRVALHTLGGQEIQKGYCESNVCKIAACVSNSDCKNGACSQNGCSAKSGCAVTRTAGCSGAPTCGNAACSSNSGGGCGNAVCQYLAGRRRK